jgi:hypothetical protein
VHRAATGTVAFLTCHCTVTLQNRHTDRPRSRVCLFNALSVTWIRPSSAQSVDVGLLSTACPTHYGIVLRDTKTGTRIELFNTRRTRFADQRTASVHRAATGTVDYLTCHCTEPPQTRHTDRPRNFIIMFTTFPVTRFRPSSAQSVDVGLLCTAGASRIHYVAPSVLFCAPIHGDLPTFHLCIR